MFGLSGKENQSGSGKISLTDSMIDYMKGRRFYFVATRAQYKLVVSNTQVCNEPTCIIGYNMQFDTEVIMTVDYEKTQDFEFSANNLGNEHPRFRIDFAAPENVFRSISNYLREKPANEIVGITVSHTEKDGKMLYSAVELSSFLEAAPQDYMHNGAGPRAFRDSLSKTHSW